MVAVVMFQIDGLSGTGKSTLCDELARRGYHAVDADATFAYSGDPVTGAPSDVDTSDAPGVRPIFSACATPWATCSS